MFITLIPALMLAVSAAAPPQDCKDWQTCRQLAIDAAARQDYDAFHDLAWRTLNAGPRNDPALMILLARAQSLSGRPHDALVMLNRLAALGVATDAATSDDFARVRALPGWADLEANLPGKGAASPAPPPASTAAATKPPVETPPAVKVPAPVKEPVAVKDVPSTKESPPATDALPLKKPTAAAKKAAAAPLSFSAAGVDPAGLAYDSVSGRFIVADGRDRRLLVLGERSGRLASLAGIDAGFGEITALEIDSREGDLWVVSTSAPTRTSTLHKLQLISGRVLASIPLPDEQGTSRFTDVAVTPQHVLVLDSEGRRVYRAAKKGKTLEVALRLATATVSSLAPASDTVAYAAYDQGILRVDLTARSLTVVEPGQKVDLSALTWLRWYRGGLVAIQKRTDGSHRLVRIRLDEAGRTARAIDTIDESSLAGPTAATISESGLYSLSRSADTDEVVVKKVTLK